MSDFLFKVHVFAAMTMVFILPVYQKLVPLLIVLWAVTFFASKYSISFWKRLFTFKTGLISIAFLLICSITLFYTDYWESGVFDVESKLSFFIFPLVLSSSAYHYRRQDFNMIFYSFLGGLVIASLYCLYLAFYKIIVLDAPFQYMTYIDLSYFMHPSYFSMYLCFGIVVIYHLLKIDATPHKRARIFLLIIALFFSSVIILLSSKAGIIVLFVLFIVILIDFVKKKVVLLSMMALVIALLVTLFFTNGRFESMRKGLGNAFNQEQQDVKESNQLRASLWLSAAELLKSNWLLGLGGGDLKYDLTEQSEIVILDQSDNRIYFNAHNQWLETFLSYGILGLTLMILWMIVPLFHIAREYRFIMIGLFIIIFLNSIFESIFNRQEGIVFVVFFWTLVASRSSSLVDKNKAV
jgi:O-antigen ligase